MGCYTSCLKWQLMCPGHLLLARRLLHDITIQLSCTRAACLSSVSTAYLCVCVDLFLKLKSSDSVVRPQWTGTGSGTSVIWTWSNRTESGTWYTPTRDCYLLTFWLWTCRIHALNVRWCKIFIRCNISCCLFCGWCEVWFVWNKQKQQSKCYTWTESGPKNVPKPNRSNIGLLVWRGPGPGPGPVLTLAQRSYVKGTMQRNVETRNVL